MNILYIGTNLYDKNSNSYLRKESLEKLKYNNESMIHLKFYLESNYILRYFHYYTGYFFIKKSYLIGLNLK